MLVDMDMDMDMLPFPLQFRIRSYDSTTIDIQTYSTCKVQSLIKVGNQQSHPYLPQLIAPTGKVLGRDLFAKRLQYKAVFALAASLCIRTLSYIYVILHKHDLVWRGGCMYGCIISVG